MPAMLVKLYNLPDIAPALRRAAEHGVTIRNPRPWDKEPLLDWVTEHFGAGWARECEYGFRTLPPSCLIAVRDTTLLGFACYDCTARNFFGPTGVLESERGQGIGHALLLAAMERIRNDGYGYAIIGGVGPAAFYAKAVGATVIRGSSPGIYADELEGCDDD